MYLKPYSVLHERWKRHLHELKNPSAQLEIQTELGRKRSKDLGDVSYIADQVVFWLKSTYLLTDSSAKSWQQLHSRVLADPYLPTVKGLAINLLNNATENFVSSDPNLPKWRTGNLYNRETG